MYRNRIRSLAILAGLLLSSAVCAQQNTKVVVDLLSDGNSYTFDACTLSLHKVTDIDANNEITGACEVGVSNTPGGAGPVTYTGAQPSYAVVAFYETSYGVMAFYNCGQTKYLRSTFSEGDHTLIHVECLTSHSDYSGVGLFGSSFEKPRKK